VYAYLPVASFRDWYLQVGDYYYYGKGGVPVDKGEAAMYYKLAADMRNPHALFNLGVMFESGDGVVRDFHLAKRFFDQVHIPDAHVHVDD
jgi:TPR repeat protein